MIAQSQSGTGKTAAFVLAMLSRVDTTKDYPQVIISAIPRCPIHLFFYFLSPFFVVEKIPCIFNCCQLLEIRNLMSCRISDSSIRS